MIIFWTDIIQSGLFIGLVCFLLWLKPSSFRGANGVSPAKEEKKVRCNNGEIQHDGTSN